MYNSYVLRRTNDGIYTFDRINPEEAVYCAVFKDKIFNFSLTDYSGLKERIINVLSTLKKRENYMRIILFLSPYQCLSSKSSFDIRLTLLKKIIFL